MDRHGNNDWLGPLLEDLGPFIQLQVADFASCLEACSNFYQFCSAPATRATLCLIASLFLVSAFTDSRFVLKMFWAILGIIFFLLWPISSLYPRFRLLVSPMKIALWGVPNHPEWCFQYLQERAAVVREGLVLHAPDGDLTLNGQDGLSRLESLNIDSDHDSFHSVGSTGADDHLDILSFVCTYRHIPGRFIVSTYGLRFEATLGKPLPHEGFIKSYAELVEMSKQQSRFSRLMPVGKVTTSLDKLELRFRGMEGGAGMHQMGEREHAEIIVLDNMRGRDKAFNAIIAFSNLRWQHLQQRQTKVRPGEKKGDSLTDE